ncbi:LOW QUALITY PROTEIN: uncharacterized protein LOC124416260 [Diprion similis]|uniref:LOW QUALITY PROTEIN: uncharacterized protein LOC124416260 n=1 Tax=Diprion similis TaxID=362088 RepID=UPI001EF81590|nr:LOW QUALITY PROTEIN: uncharacterized protein LOC124416260 [Diprion similis]
MCLKALGRPGADLSFLEAMLWLNKTSMSRNEINRSKIELKHLMSSPCTVAKPEANPELFPPPKIVVPNLKIPCASDAVEIAYSKKYGRHLIANRKIKPGEVLVVEKTFCKRLLPQNMYMHCSNCWQLSWAMIPCKSCINVAYCSEACKDEAWESYHEVECTVIGFLISHELNDDIFLTMRMAIMATQKGKKIDALKQELMTIDQNTDPCTMGCDKDGIFHSDNYRSIYCSKFGGGNEWVTEHLLSATISIAIAMCMLVRESKMFGERLALHASLKNPDVLLVGGLMFGVSRGQKFHQYGHALMAVSSLLNHSCDANTTRQFLRDGIAIHAIYPIEQGEQIFDNYFTVPYALIPKKMRQELFKEWKFDCECLPCAKNWPMMEDIPSFKDQPLTRQVKTELAKLPVESIILEFGEQIKTNIYSLETLNKLTHMVEMIHKLARKPCRELMIVVMMLKVLYDKTIFDYEPADQLEAREEKPSGFAHAPESSGDSSCPTTRKWRLATPAPPRRYSEALGSAILIESQSASCILMQGIVAVVSERCLFLQAASLDFSVLLTELTSVLWCALSICMIGRETEIFRKKMELNYTFKKNPEVILVDELMLRNVDITLMKATVFGASCSTSYDHGLALLALCGLPNHSCDPKTVEQWYTDHLALFAAYPIEKGEQIFRSYIPCYIVMEKSKRRGRLQDRNLMCEYLPCKEAWPTLFTHCSYQQKAVTQEGKIIIDDFLRQYLVTHGDFFLQKDITQNISNIITEVVEMNELLHNLVQKPVVNWTCQL